MRREERAGICRREVLAVYYGALLDEGLQGAALIGIAKRGQALPEPPDPLLRRQGADDSVEPAVALSALQEGYAFLSGAGAAAHARSRSAARRASARCAFSACPPAPDARPATAAPRATPGVACGEALKFAGPVADLQYTVGTRAHGPVDRGEGASNRSGPGGSRSIGGGS